MCIARLRSKIRQNRAEKRPFPHPFMQKTASSLSERERVNPQKAKTTKKQPEKHQFATKKPPHSI